MNENDLNLIDFSDFDFDNCYAFDGIYPENANNKKICSEKHKKNIFYEKPENTGFWIVERKDKNGNTFWLNWSSWISCIEIKNQNDIKNLPSEILNLFSKWGNLLNDNEVIKKGKKIENQCPIKNVSLHFIFNDDIYKLTPDTFSSEYMIRYYFEAIEKIIEQDLQDMGCIYTEYWADID